MSQILIQAVCKAQEHLERVANNGSKAARQKLKEELEALTKEEVIERLLDTVYPPTKTNKGLIEKAAYAILEDDDCRILDYETISQLIKKAYPWAKTTANGIGWYASSGLSNGRDVKPRFSKEDIRKILMG